MTHRIARRVERRRLIAGAALTMEVLLAVVLRVAVDRVERARLGPVRGDGPLGPPGRACQRSDDTR
jgi:hypothetical protein